MAEPTQTTHAVRAWASSHLAFALIVLLFGWTAVVTAWLADDAFISFRQVLNALDGYGYTWNYGQRVQAFTHPSWVLLLTVVVALTNEIHLTTIVLSIALSLLSVLWIVGCARALPEGQCRPVLLYSLVVTLAFSKAFTDFMTSGLENALSFCLVGLAIWQSRLLDDSHPSGARLTLVFMTLALAVLNRFDHVLLVAPLAAYVLVTAWRGRLLRAAIPGAVMVLAWLLFATVYFGAPLPNTYYAKLVAGFPASEIQAHGAAYLAVTFSQDPVTLVLVACGALAGLMSASWLYRSVALGILTYTAYLFVIGGDFMQGRFFAILAYAGVFTLVAIDERRMGPLVFKVATLLVLVPAIAFGPKPPLSTRAYRDLTFRDGITDERGIWYERYGLLSPAREWPAISSRTAHRPDQYRVTCGGADALIARDVLWVDVCALGDAFLARLPAVRSRDWRVGHLYRKIPTDYADVLVGRAAALEDTAAQSLLDDVTLAVVGPLWSADRARAIARLNLGHTYGFDRQRYADPAIVVPFTSGATELDYEQFNHDPREDGANWLVVVAEGVVWPQAQVATEFWKALSITVRTPVTSEALSLSVDGNDAYRVIVNDGEFEARIEMSPDAEDGGHLRNHHLELARPMVITRVRIEPVAGDGHYAVGHLLLEPAAPAR